MSDETSNPTASAEDGLERATVAPRTTTAAKRRAPRRKPSVDAYAGAATTAQPTDATTDGAPPARRRNVAATPCGAPTDDGAPARRRKAAASPTPASTPSRAKRAGLPSRDKPVPDRQTGDEGARQALAMARRVVDLAADKKAADIVLIAVGELTTIADYLVICSGGSERQLGAIADGIAQGLKDVGIAAIGREGESSAHWVLMDFGSVIVHVFAQPERDFYQLEKLWSDAPMLLRVQ